MYSNPSQWTRIRRRVLLNGESRRTVSKSERMSRRTVQKILLIEAPPGYRSEIRQRDVIPCEGTPLGKPGKGVKGDSRWRSWLAALERGCVSSGFTADVDQELKALLLPESITQRKKALVVLARDQGFSIRRISVLSGISRNTIRLYLSAFHESGVAGLLERKQRAKKSEGPEVREALFQLLHEPPSLSGVNRTIWRLTDLRTALAKKGIDVGREVIQQIIKSAGYRWRSAKVVLTSTDPAYREKLAHVQSVLGQLQSTERFFSIDEYGPFAIKMKAGRSLVGPDEYPSVPQWQASKGWLILTAALELSTNQVSHFYSLAKNTNEMIRMIGVLVEQYCDATKVYISWDAASWHMSKALARYIDDHNQVAVENGRPMVELVPLPASAQFLNVIESVFSGMARSIIHGSNYESKDAAITAIDQYFVERNESFRANPRPAGKKIWGKERNLSEFSSGHNCKDPAYR